MAMAERLLPYTANIGECFISHVARLCMAAGYLFPNCSCILICEMSFSDRWAQIQLLCIIFIVKISHYGKFTALHRLIFVLYD